MTPFWLGAIAATITWWALLTITLVALRGAERGTPMAASHWPLDNAEDALDAEHRALIERDAA